MYNLFDSLAEKSPRFFGKHEWCSLGNCVYVLVSVSVCVCTLPCLLNPSLISSRTDYIICEAKCKCRLLVQYLFRVLRRWQQSIILSTGLFWAQFLQQEAGWCSLEHTPFSPSPQGLRVRMKNSCFPVLPLVSLVSSFLRKKINCKILEIYYHNNFKCTVQWY